MLRIGGNNYSDTLGYDNSEQKGDHRHFGGLEEPYTFTSLRQLADDFMADVELIKRSKR